MSELAHLTMSFLELQLKQKCIIYPKKGAPNFLKLEGTQVVMNILLATEVIEHKEARKSKLECGLLTSLSTHFVN